ncbi:uncharacterized protein [Emydura macquarii macquarii]|uniref:uncharacterized protein n=1 Tax=Emydura macquarii macquarii TaxID=1129001 RepID=UPI00352AD137
MTPDPPAPPPRAHSRRGTGPAKGDWDSGREAAAAALMSPPPAAGNPPPARYRCPGSPKQRTSSSPPPPPKASAPPRERHQLSPGPAARAIPSPRAAAHTAALRRRRPGEPPGRRRPQGRGPAAGRGLPAPRPRAESNLEKLGCPQCRGGERREPAGARRGEAAAPAPLRSRGGRGDNVRLPPAHTHPDLPRRRGTLPCPPHCPPDPGGRIAPARSPSAAQGSYSRCPPPLSQGRGQAPHTLRESRSPPHPASSARGGVIAPVSTGAADSLAARPVLSAHRRLEAELAAPCDTRTPPAAAPPPTLPLPRGGEQQPPLPPAIRCLSVPAVPAPPLPEPPPRRLPRAYTTRLGGSSGQPQPGREGKEGRGRHAGAFTEVTRVSGCCCGCRRR